MSPATVGVEKTHPPVSYCQTTLPTVDSFGLSPPSCRSCAPSQATPTESSTIPAAIRRFGNRITHLLEHRLCWSTGNSVPPLKDLLCPIPPESFAIAPYFSFTRWRR